MSQQSGYFLKSGSHSIQLLTGRELYADTCQVVFHMHSLVNNSMSCGHFRVVPLSIYRECSRIASSQIAMAFCNTNMCHPIARASACAPVSSIALVFIVTAVRLLLEIYLSQHSTHDWPETLCRHLPVDLSHAQPAEHQHELWTLQCALPLYLYIKHKTVCQPVKCHG